MRFEKAERRRAHLRLALCGPSGSGKTWTGLTIASDFSDKIAVIDTERGSASLYADQFRFATADFQPPYDPRTLIEGMREAAGYVGQGGVVMVDSLSHFWMGEGGLLDIVDDAAKRMKNPNSFAAWKEGTPIQNALLEALIGLPCHLIVTMRAKQDYVQEKDEKTGRTAVRKIGLAPVQRDGIEYEFTVTADMDHEHNIVITKTRCHQIADKLYRPGHASDLGTTLKGWLLSGGEAAAPAPVQAPPAARTNGAPAPPAEPPTAATDPQIAVSRKAFRDALVELGWQAEFLKSSTEMARLIAELAPALGGRDTRTFVAMDWEALERLLRDRVGDAFADDLPGQPASTPEPAGAAA